MFTLRIVILKCVVAATYATRILFQNYYCRINVTGVLKQFCSIPYSLALVMIVLFVSYIYICNIFLYMNLYTNLQNKSVKRIALCCNHFNIILLLYYCIIYYRIKKLNIYILLNKKYILSMYFFGLYYIYIVGLQIFIFTKLKLLLHFFEFKNDSIK